MEQGNSRSLRADQNSRRSRGPIWDAWREFRRNRVALVSGVVILGIVLMAVLAPWITPYDDTTQNVANLRAKPLTRYTVAAKHLEKCHWAGTPLEAGCGLFLAGSDGLGRDLWSRTVYGARVSLAVAFVGSVISLAIGVVYGTISGYAGGRTDDLMMRFVDFMYAIPGLSVIILLQVYFKDLARQDAGGILGAILELNAALGGLLFLFIAMGALSWIGTARLARGQVLSYKQREFVEAARAVGAGRRRILFRHLLPSIIGPLLIVVSFSIPGWIFFEAALSFIGLGVNPPTPSWGAMITDGYQGLRSNPHLVLVPGLALTTLALAFNFAGDGLRDAIDPRLRGR